MTAAKNVKLKGESTTRGGGDSSNTRSNMELPRQGNVSSEEKIPSLGVEIERIIDNNHDIQEMLSSLTARLDPILSEDLTEDATAQAIRSPEASQLTNMALNAIQQQMVVKRMIDVILRRINI